LAWALATGDYRLVYVAESTNRATSWPYRLAGLWGGMEGSLLFWSWLLSLAAVLGLRSLRRHRPDLLDAVAAVLTGLTGAFVAVGAVFADPFATLAVPAIDGGGLAPILEHPAMLYHPPLLYAGLVLLAVPFALAVVGSARRSCDTAWLAVVRRFTGVAWVILTVGMVAGAHWAYAELGWGGYWAWDPVENAALLPWLGATALLHAVVADEHAGRVGRATPALALATFVLAVGGAVLTRSGAATSVHAFAEARSVGRALAAVVVVVAVTAWVSWRRHRPAGGRRRLGLASRGAALVANAVLVVGLAVVVAWGTFLPVVVDLVGGEPFVVSGRYFALLTAPLALGVLALVGLAPALRWSGGLVAGERATVRLALAAGAGVAVAAVALGLRQPFALAAAPLAAFSGTLVVVRLAGHLGPGRPWRWRAGGGSVAHLGVVVLLAGVAGSSAGSTQTLVLAPGAEVEAGAYRLRHEGVAVAPTSRGDQRVRLEVGLSRSGERIAVLHPEQVVFEGRGLVLAETALRSTPWEDVLVALRRVNDDGTAVLEVSVRPLVMWVWWGGLLVAAGGALALRGPLRRLPDPRGSVVDGAGPAPSLTRAATGPRACAPAVAPPSSGAPPARSRAEAEAAPAGASAPAPPPAPGARAGTAAAGAGIPPPAPPGPGPSAPGAGG
ncbi:MAG: cytochrome c biogenesis protein CcsA, partial [Actinobacteria bacterium]|nr:cytochrome c biogenesis protein CcsA [Actinomycetota bacterium]